MSTHSRTPPVPEQDAAEPMAVELSTMPSDEFGNLVSGLDGYIEDYLPGFSKFLQLPLELREKIYMQYLVAVHSRSHRTAHL
jgi:hypothetical protein